MNLKKKLEKFLYDRVYIVLDYAYEVYAAEVDNPIEHDDFFARVLEKMKGGNGQ